MQSTVLVLGSGPIRIGQGIEFDYSCVHCVWALEQMGYRAVLINNNPETVSTDFDTSDGLYFEPVTLEDVLDVIGHQSSFMGAVVQFGGQTAINLAQGLRDSGIKVLGTSPTSIAAAEDRDLFEKLLSELEIPKPPGRAVRSLQAAREVAEEVGYPVLVRPSFVLGGRAMEIVWSEDQLEEFYGEAEAANPGQPVLVDKYFMGAEAEVDVISDGEDTLVPGIMEHIERAGVHSGDSMAVYPAITLSEHVQAQMVVFACKIARSLQVKGLMNIQFVIVDETAYVLEVNPRGSRTIPYISKVTGIPMVDIATRCMMGERLKDLGYSSGLWVLEKGRRDSGTEGQVETVVAGSLPEQHGTEGRRNVGTSDPRASTRPKAKGRILPESEFYQAVSFRPSVPLSLIPTPVLYAVKAPVFSFQKLTKVEPSLGPEMKSTGEILGLDNTFEGALYKALIAAGITFKGKGHVLLTVQDPDKADAVEIARRLKACGYSIAATGGTHDALKEAGIESRWMMKISEGEPNLLTHILGGEVSLMINTPGTDAKAEREAAQIRRACIETGIACITNIDTAKALATALDVYQDPSKASCKRLEEYFLG
ncbi:MAG: ATP-grasp domain-containing protein [Armatimonadetes bacterium]|nr:ATP-grasp domain-containing protein [Armatimonadota bacterium]